MCCLGYQVCQTKTEKSANSLYTIQGNENKKLQCCGGKIVYCFDR